MTDLLTPPAKRAPHAEPNTPEGPLTPPTITGSTPRTRTSAGFLTPEARIPAEPVPPPPQGVLPPANDLSSSSDAPSVADLHNDWDHRSIYASVLAGQLTVHQDARQALAHQIRALVQDKGMEGQAEVLLLQDLLKQAKSLEEKFARQLDKAMRGHQLGPWIASRPGIGGPGIGRLIAATGDPYIKPAMVDADTGEVLEPARPRSVAELRSYCGLGNAAEQKRRRGVQSKWNTEAKVRILNIARPVEQNFDNYYRPVYDAAKADWAERDCTGMHRRNHAVRVVAKAILKDLWLEARRLHEEAAR
jgi:hypothetical protein